AVVAMIEAPPRRLVLWGVGTSRTLRAHWAMHELGLDYECHPILPRTGETPPERREYATWLEWCFYAATELDATSLYVMRRHGALKHIYGEAPVALESAAAYFAKQLRHADKR